MHLILLSFVAVLAQASASMAPLSTFRPPSVPLVTTDPLVSIWSMSETLFGDSTKQWDKTPKIISGIIKVDGDPYRFMGASSSTGQQDTVQQLSVKVWPTRTIYEFQDPGRRVLLTVQFTTPLLPNWDIASMPVTYITYKVTSLDGRPHRVKLYHMTGQQVALNVPEGDADWIEFRLLTSKSNIAVNTIMSILESSLDTGPESAGLDWRYIYVAVAEDHSLRIQRKRSSLGPSILTIAWDVAVYPEVDVTKYVTMTFDEIYAIDFFGHRFPPYWKTRVANHDVTSLLRKAFDTYQFVLRECEQFDRQLVNDLEIRGGPKYATLAALAYRQTMASTKLVWNHDLQIPWAFLKTPTITDDLSTVDVIMPASPLFLYVDPARLQALLLPLLAYANNDTESPQHYYPYPWAPHHLGVYPNATILPKEQLNMPMEESGNVLLMLAAVTRRLGSTSVDFWYPKYWTILQTWADRLYASLPDPGTQRWTDNFLPSTPHNANLAIKGILGLGAFSQLCTAVGKYSLGGTYYQKARKLAKEWVTLAKDGDHYKLSYDQKNTWSLKYNLFYEKVLRLRLFPGNVIAEEMQFYLAKQLNPFGVPLDNRVTYTKLDWLAWVAAMTDDATQQQELFNRLYNWANATYPMTPLTDLYDTITGKQVAMAARPVVGALYGLLIV